MTNLGTVAPETSEATPSTIWDELDAWGKTLRDWQRWVLECAIDGTRLTEEQIATAFKLLLKETGLRSTDEPLPSVRPRLAVRPSTSAPTVRLRGLSKLKNVNALTPDAALSFGDGLTAIYGANGAGKTGFVRLLSACCFSRSRPEILPNVHSTTPTSEEASGEFTFVAADQPPSPAVLSSRVSSDDARRITVFDSNVARLHLTEENQLAFRPAGMDVFSEVSRVLKTLAERLQLEISGEPAADFRAHLPAGAEVTDVGRALGAVSASGSAADLHAFRQLAAYGEAQAERRTQLAQRVADVEANAVDKELRAVAKARDALKTALGRLRILEAALGPSAQAEYAEQFRHVASASTAAAASAAENFQVEGLRAVGTPPWRGFASAARELARAEGEYPHHGEPCLLCHRPLDEPSLILLRRLWDFVDGPARNALASANAVVQRSVRNLETLDLKLAEATNSSADPGGVASMAPDVVAELTAVGPKLESLRASIVSALQGAGPFPSDALTFPFDVLTEAEARLAAREEELRRIDPTATLAELRKELHDLDCRETAARLLPDVEAFAAKKQWCGRAREVVTRDLSTRGITSKEKDFFERFVEGSYLAGLEMECKTLDCKTPVKLVTRGHRGETLRSLVVRSGNSAASFPETLRPPAVS